jgi:hypothetical protein
VVAEAVPPTEDKAPQPDPIIEALQSQTASKARATNLPKPAGSSGPRKTETATRTAAITPPTPTRLERPAMPSGSGAALPPGTSVRSAPATPVAQSGRAAQVAQAPGPSISVVPEPAVSAIAAQVATVSGTKTVATSRLKAAIGHAAQLEQPSAISFPAEVKVEAGTRVWISLKSVRQRPDGVSEFNGVVLLPVTQSGAVVFARNTEVSGTTMVRNGKRSVQILEFLSAGARYRLRSPSGEANLRLLGAGEVVEFDAGRVLETWMAAASTYEKVAGEPRVP